MNEIKGGGIGLGTIVFAIFLVLKLCGVITWSWWWVFAPLWIPIALGVGIWLIVMVVAFLAGAIAILLGKKKK